MRTLAKNKQKLHYALYKNDVPIYEKDANGNVVYITVDGVQVPVETGYTTQGYYAPVAFYGNIALQGGESEAQEFGLSLSDYSAVLLVDRGVLPIDETSLIWHTTTPLTNPDGTAVKESADYTVVKVSPSLNQTRYVLNKVVK